MAEIAKQSIELPGGVVQSISRVLSSIMHIDEARRQTFEVNFSQFIANFVHLVNANSNSNLQRIERAEVAANSLKTLRLLTDDLQIATRINHNQPNLLANLTPLMFEY